MSEIKVEEWRDIDGFEGCYQVSNIGRVKSLKRVVMRKDGKPLTVHERILKAYKNEDGYLLVRLSGNGKERAASVHRFVAETFIPNPGNKPQVNHINEDKTNNCVNNLEWVTNIENVNHGTWNERRIASVQKQVTVISPGGEVSHIESISDAAKFMGLKSIGGLSERLLKGIVRTKTGFMAYRRDIVGGLS